MNPKTKPGLVDLLFVEDDLCDAELTLRALLKGGLKLLVHLARDGEEALEFVLGERRHAGRSSSDTPKLILLDLTLPKVHGLSLLSLIKADPRTQAIPVIVLTSSEIATDPVDCHLLGANRYLSKPLDVTLFVTAVRELGLASLLLHADSVSAV